MMEVEIWDIVTTIVTMSAGKSIIAMITIALNATMIVIRATITTAIVVIASADPRKNRS